MIKFDLELVSDRVLGALYIVAMHDLTDSRDQPECTVEQRAELQSNIDVIKEELKARGIW